MALIVSKIIYISRYIALFRFGSNGAESNPTWVWVESKLRVGIWVPSQKNSSRVNIRFLRGGQTYDGYNRNIYPEVSSEFVSNAKDDMSMEQMGLAQDTIVEKKMSVLSHQISVIEMTERTNGDLKETINLWGNLYEYELEAP